MHNFSNLTANSTQPSVLTVSMMSSNNQYYNEPWLFWFRLVSIIALTICVVIGNLMVLYCLFTIRELHTVTGVFLTNLAVTDLGVGLVSLPLTLVSGIERFLIRQKWFCTLQGISLVLFVLASLLTLGALSLTKYLNVGYRVQKRVNKKHARYFIVAIWVTAALFAITPVFGFSRYDYNSGGHQCAPYEASVPGYIYAGLLLILGILLPCTTMLYCYCKLYMMTHLHNRRMRVSDSEDRNHSRHCLSSVELHMIHTLMIMVISLFICCTPAFIFYFLKFTRILHSNAFDTIVMLCLFANSAVNPILYAMRQKDFQRGFGQIFRRVCHQ